MSVPTEPKLRQVAGLVDRIGNFGSWPPTEAYRDTFHGQGVILNLRDPAIATGAQGAAQILGIRSHGCFGAVWEPVPPAGEDGASRAKGVSDRVAMIDLELARQGAPPIPLVWLNLEGYTIVQWRAFLWGRPGGVKGWRGTDGVIGSTGGYRPGRATGIIDEPFKDSTVKPHADFQVARVMLAVEAFYGPNAEHPDMTPADHPQAMIDRLEDDDYPAEQVVGCYDAALGAVVRDLPHGVPAEPILIRHGLHFTLERARQAAII